MSNIYGRWKIEQRITRPDGSVVCHISRQVGRWSLDRHWMGPETRLYVPLGEVEDLLEKDAAMSKKYGARR